MASLFGRKKDRTRRDSVSNSNNSELNERSVPYDRLAPSARSPIPVGTVSQSMRQGSPNPFISAPMTNPTLTAEGTDINMHAAGPRRRSDRNHRTDGSFTDGTPSSPGTSNGAGSSKSPYGNDPRASSSTLASSVYSSTTRRKRETDSASVGSAPTSGSATVRSSLASLVADKRSNSGQDFGVPPSPRPSTSTRPSSTATLKSDVQRGSRYAASIASAANSELQTHLPHFHLPHRSQDEFIFPKPDNPAEIEALFARVKSTRDMPDNFNPDLDQKWLIVYNHEQLRWQEERAKMEQTRRRAAQGQSSTSVYSKDSPEWYLKKFMDMTVTPKHVAGLAVSLRTLPVGYTYLLER